MDLHYYFFESRFQSKHRSFKGRDEHRLSGVDKVAGDLIQGDLSEGDVSVERVEKRIPVARETQIKRLFDLM